MQRALWAVACLLAICLCLAAAHAADARASGHAAWFPSLRLIVRHSDRALGGYISQIADQVFNHDHAGVTCLQPPLHRPTAVPKGFRVNSRRQLLGNGVEVYEQAVRLGLKEGGVVNRLPWANLIFAEADWKRWKPGMSLLTVVKCYGLLWSANPCKVVAVRWDESTPRDVGRGRYSSVIFSTVVGHLLAGEERFSVEYQEQDSSVWLDLYSVSRGAGVLGKIAMPFIRPIQKAFFAAQCHEMLKLVQERESPDSLKHPRRHIQKR